MRALKNTFFALLIIAVLFFVIGFFLPQHVHVERSLKVDATAERLYPYIDNPRSFNQWSPWAKIDPGTQFTFSGPDSGEGATMTWFSDNPNVGSGTWVIIEAVENQSTRIKLDFGAQGGAFASLDLAPDNGSTEVTWAFDMDTGMNPMHRWFGLMMDDWVGADYEKGLNTLKSLLEQQTENEP